MELGTQCRHPGGQDYQHKQVAEPGGHGVPDKKRNQLIRIALSGLYGDNSGSFHVVDIGQGADDKGGSYSHHDKYCPDNNGSVQFLIAFDSHVAHYQLRLGQDFLFQPPEPETSK